MTVLSDVVHEATAIHGVVAGAVVDIESGNCLARAGGDELFSLSLIGAVNAQILRSKIRLVEEQFPQENIEDLMVTLGKHYHLIQLIPGSGGTPRLFLYVVLCRDGSNLVLTRRKMTALGLRVQQTSGVQEQVEIAQFAAYLRSPSSAGAKGLNDKLEMSEDPDEEELPPFMREDTVMRLLSAAEDSCRLAMAA
jgi:hypothetical protein